MPRKSKKLQQSKRRYLNILISITLWKRLQKCIIKSDESITTVVKDALDFYLEDRGY